MSVDGSVFVVSPEQDDLLGILELESHEQADDFQTEGSTVYIVAQEYIVERLDVHTFIRPLPDVEEAHEVYVVSVDVAEYLDWGFHALNHHRLVGHDALALTGQVNNLLLLEGEGSRGRYFLSFLWIVQSF